DIFPFTALSAPAAFHLSMCRASSIRSATRNSDRPAARAMKGSTAPTSVQLVGKECKRPNLSRTRPCPHPSPGGRKLTRTLAGKADGADVLLGNVEPQRRHTAQLNTHANASCESFIKTLKREEIYAHKYENLEHLRTNIEEFIDEYYNRQRLHSALGYRSPEEFERKSECQADNRGATIEAFVNKE